MVSNSNKAILYILQETERESQAEAIQTHLL